MSGDDPKPGGDGALPGDTFTCPAYATRFSGRQCADRWQLATHGLRGRLPYPGGGGDTYRPGMFWCDGCAAGSDRAAALFTVGEPRMNVSVQAANNAVRDAAKAGPVVVYPTCVRCKKRPAIPVRGVVNDPRNPFCRNCRDVADTQTAAARKSGERPATPAEKVEWLRTHLPVGYGGPDNTKTKLRSSGVVRPAQPKPAPVAAMPAPVVEAPQPPAPMPEPVAPPAPPPVPAPEKTYVVLSEAQSRVLGMMGDAHGLSIDTIVRRFIRDGLAGYVAERRAELDRLVAGLDADDTAP